MVYTSRLTSHKNPINYYCSNFCLFSGSVFCADERSQCFAIYWLHTDAFGIGIFGKWHLACFI